MRIRRAALQTLAAMQPLNELQTLRVEIMKLSIDADLVLDLHCDLDAVLHLFISRRDWPGPAQLRRPTWVPRRRWSRTSPIRRR